MERLYLAILWIGEHKILLSAHRREDVARRIADEKRDQLLDLLGRGVFHAETYYGVESVPIDPTPEEDA